MKTLAAFIFIIFSSMLWAQKEATITKNNAVVTYQKECDGTSCQLTKIKVLEQGQIEHSFVPNRNQVSISVPDDQLIFIEDYNFDGYNDVRVYRQLAADGVNTLFDYWILNPDTGQYEFKEEFTTISHPQIDRDNKQIFSSWREGCCKSGTDLFRIEHGAPVMIRRVIKTYEYGVPNIKIYNRVGAGLVLEN
ncbi:XAC2610-related protein [Nonlabens spongiae]|nr:hypothetical protein [Nonlabens spongiae]